VNQENKQRFMEISEKASEIYLANGALEDNTYYADDLSGEHKCAGLIDVMNVAENETVFLGQTVFRNKSHRDDVMTQVNLDPEIIQLFAEITELIDLSKVITASFSTDK
jgi:uncharacterized protein YbaA (DUF1428 family)